MIAILILVAVFATLALAAFGLFAHSFATIVVLMMETEIERHARIQERRLRKQRKMLAAMKLTARPDFKA